MFEDIQQFANHGFPVLASAAALLGRLVVGVMFMIAGLYKLLAHDNQKTMVETLDDAGIPKPRKMSYFVAANEAFFGALLALGLLTSLAALVLLCISLVAFVTQGYESRDGRNVSYWLSILLMKHQVLLATILFFILVFGQGQYALSHLLT